MTKQVITIVGGGSSAHTLIPFLSKEGREINILTSKPELWSNTIKVELQDKDSNLLKTFKGTLKQSSNKPEDLIPHSDIIIFCMPVHQYRNALHTIAPHISNEKTTVIGTIYGQGGFNFMVDEVKQKFGLNNIVAFAIGLVPWIARIKEYGKIGITYGPKVRNIVAFDKPDYFNQLQAIFEDICYTQFKTGKFNIADNFLSLTLSVDNQIIHPTRLFGLYKQSNKGVWDTEDEVPYFYRDYYDFSAQILAFLDEDHSKIRNCIVINHKEHNFEYMLDYFSLERFSYNSANENIKQSFVESETLGAIKTPVVKNKDNKWEINRNHRFFFDDIYYGLGIAKWMAEDLNIEVPIIDKILYWAQEMLEVEIIKDSKLVRNDQMGSFNVYGFKSVNKIVS